MSQPDYDRLMKRARQTNDRRDAVDRTVGFGTPLDCGPLEALRTVDSALEAGIKTGDWNCVAEGLDMLRAILNRYHVVRARVVPNSERKPQ